MITRLAYSLCLLICLTLIAPLAPCASTTATQRLRKTTQTTASEQKTLRLLNQLLNQTKDLDDGGSSWPMKVILFKAQAANLLWDYDQARARALFTTALKSVVQLSKTRVPNNIGSSADEEHLLLKKLILNYALPHDAVFPEQLTKLLLESYPQRRAVGTDIYWLYLRDQAVLYSQIAKHIAPSNPQHAAELLRASFNGFYSYTQLEALNVLRHYTPTRTDEIFLIALTPVKRKPTNLSNKIGLLSQYLFPEIQNTAGNELSRSGNAGEPSQVNPALIKPFLEFVFDNFMQQPVAAQTAENNEFGSASFNYRTMQGLVPHFERHLPEKAAAYRAQVNNVIASINKAGRKDMFDREADAWAWFFSLKVQDLLDRAAAAKTPQERDEHYLKAASLLAYKDADYDQALSLLDRVSDSQEKSYTLRTVRHMRIEKAIKDGDADRAYSYLKALADVDKSSEHSISSRFSFLIKTARLYARKREADKAKALLEEVKAELDSLSHVLDIASSMDRLASVAVEISTEFGFQMMEAAVVAFNKLKPSGVGWGIGSDGKLTFSGGSDFNDNFAPLAKVDFDRALKLARTIKSKEGALLAQFAICKGLLEK